MTTTVAAPTTGTTYPDVAQALREIADKLDALPADLPTPWVSLGIAPADDNDSDERQIADIDTVCRALLGVDGTTNKLPNGNYHRSAIGLQGPIHVNVYDRVANPEEVKLRAELARLRALVGEATP